eukprot:2188597-Rhodomonas_salina.1
MARTRVVGAGSADETNTAALVRSGTSVSGSLAPSSALAGPPCRLDEVESALRAPYLDLLYAERQQIPGSLLQANRKEEQSSTSGHTFLAVDTGLLLSRNT